MEIKEKNSTKAYVLGALIITVSLVIIGVSMSYAYFVNRVEEINPENKDVLITSGDLVMSFASSRTINATAVGLINDADITAKAEHTDFSVTLPSDAKANSAVYRIYLTDLNISNNLKSADLKWSLYNGGTSIANGDFASIGTNTTLSLKENITINKGNTDAYVLYIWLSNDPDNNQTSLLNGSFSGKVGFTGATK